MKIILRILLVVYLGIFIESLFSCISCFFYKKLFTWSMVISLLQCFVYYVIFQFWWWLGLVTLYAFVFKQSPSATPMFKFFFALGASFLLTCSTYNFFEAVYPVRTFIICLLTCLSLIIGLAQKRKAGLPE